MRKLHSLVAILLVVAACHRTGDTTLAHSVALAAATNACAPPPPQTCSHALPDGFSTAVPPTTVGTLGLDVAATQDENGDPMFAYRYQHVDGDGAPSPPISKVYFARWDRCAGAYTAPVVIDGNVSEVVTGGPERAVAIAYDAGRKQIAVVYNLRDLAANANNPPKKLFLQVSDDMGQTWKNKTYVSPQSANDAQQASAPAVTMGHGRIQIAYTQLNRACCPMSAPGGCAGCSAYWYLDGDGTHFTRQTIQDGNGPIPYGSVITSMQLDAQGNVGLAFVASDFTRNRDYNGRVMFWRPDGREAVTVMDSHNGQVDDPSVSLTFFGTQPRIAAHLVPDVTAPFAYDLRFSQSDDDGMSWSTPAPLPRDQSEGTAFYQAIAVNSHDHVAILAADATGTGDEICGAPKLLESDNHSTWTVCGADVSKNYVGVSGIYVQAYYTPGDKLTSVFQGTLGAKETGNGIVVWRQP